MIVKKHFYSKKIIFDCKETPQIYALHKNLYMAFNFYAMLNYSFFFLTPKQTDPYHLQPICISCDVPSSSPIHI